MLYETCNVYMYVRHELWFADESQIFCGTVWDRRNGTSDVVMILDVSTQIWSLGDYMSSLEIYMLYACISTLYDNREGVDLKV